MLVYFSLLAIICLYNKSQPSILVDFSFQSCPDEDPIMSTLFLVAFENMLLPNEFPADSHTCLLHIHINYTGVKYAGSIFVYNTYTIKCSTIYNIVMQLLNTIQIPIFYALLVIVTPSGCSSQRRCCPFTYGNCHILF